MRLSDIPDTNHPHDPQGYVGKREKPHEIRVTIDEWKKLGDVVESVIPHIEMLLYEDSKK